VSTAAFDTLAKGLDPPLLLVTTASRDQRAGCLVGFHSQCSIDPLRYAVWLSKANLTYRVAVLATHVALHVPVPGDEALVELFGSTTGDDVDKFALCEWEPGPGGAPLLDQCPNRIVLARTSLHDDGGDHACFVGAVLHADASDPPAPLRLSTAEDIDPGHDADEPAALVDEAKDRFEDVAAGAGHAIDLSEPRP
jgi:flavin reductase (DIM6/NTAB) family NADH-FMN oxidoreductase RutF